MGINRLHTEDGSSFYTLLKWAAVLIAALIVGGLLTSCSPARRITRIAANHPGALAGPCAQFYPVRVIDSTRIELIPGDTEYSYDTVQIDCDSVLFEWAIRNGIAQATFERIAKPVVVRVPCPPASHRVDTVVTDRFRQVENTAKVAMLEQDLEVYKAEAYRFKNGRNTWRWMAVGIGAVMLIGFVLKRFVKIPFL